MTHPAVKFVLDEIKNNWSAGAFADVPLERIDRDNSESLDGRTRSHTRELQVNNLVGAAFADRNTSPIGTEYDHDLDAIVGVRIEGLHVSEHGNIDPDASFPPTNPGDAVPWYDMRKEIQDAILTSRTFPNTNQPDIDFTDLQVTNESPADAEYGDYYRYDFDIIFNGFETLP